MPGLFSGSTTDINTGRREVHQLRSSLRDPYDTIVGRAAKDTPLEADGTPKLIPPPFDKAIRRERGIDTPTLGSCAFYTYTVLKRDDLTGVISGELENKFSGGALTQKTTLSALCKPVR
jgi:hypothetical protein